MERWTSRLFDFDDPIERWAILMERVRGTPARVEDKIRGWPAARLIERVGERWSIQEHVGHLIDLDHLGTRA